MHIQNYGPQQNVFLAPNSSLPGLEKANSDVFEFIHCWGGGLEISVNVSGKGGGRGKGVRVV